MSHSLPKAILFDLDGTLLLWGNPDKSWRDVCEAYAPQLGGVTAAGLYESVSSVRNWYWSDAERHRIGRLNMQATRVHIVNQAIERLGITGADAVAAQIAAGYARLQDDGAMLAADAVSTIESIREQWVKLALITNGSADIQRGKVTRFDLARHFDCVLIEGEFGIGKPDERVYLHALDQLNAAAADTWMVGDNLEWEVVVPQRLGIHGILIDYGVKVPMPVSADATSVVPFRSIKALAELLLPGDVQAVER